MNFERPDSIYFQAALGWLELGNWREAIEEIENLSPANKEHPEVLLLRCQVYHEAKKWDCLAEVAETLRQQRSDNFTKDWRIPYRVACYYAQCGRLEKCKVWFLRAMMVSEDAVKRAAVDEPDLKPLWDSMSGTMWRRE